MENRREVGAKKTDLGSISPTFYEQLLHVQSPKAQKRRSTQAAFCAFGICMHKKLCVNTLMKLTPGLFYRQSLSLPQKKAILAHVEQLSFFNRFLRAKISRKDDDSDIIIQCISLSVISIILEIILIILKLKTLCITLTVLTFN